MFTKTVAVLISGERFALYMILMYEECNMNRNLNRCTTLDLSKHYEHQSEESQA